MENQILDTDSGPVEYAVEGTGNRILYFHGTGAANELVFPFEQPLLDSGFQLVVPNRPGYYGTPLLDRRSASACAKLANQLLDGLAIDKVAVIGTSGGGPPASRFATEFPDRTACLVLQCAQAHRWDNTKWLPKGMGWSLPLFHIRLLRPFMRVYNRVVCTWRRRRAKHFVQAYQDAELDMDELENAQQLIPMLLEASEQCSRKPAGIENDWNIYLGDNWIEPGAIRCPTLVIHDPSDLIVPFAHAEWALRAIDNAEFCSVGAGHLIWIGRDAVRMHDQRITFLRQHFAQSD